MCPWMILTLGLPGVMIRNGMNDLLVRAASLKRCMLLLFPVRSRCHLRMLFMPAVSVLLFLMYSVKALYFFAGRSVAAANVTLVLSPV